MNFASICINFEASFIWNFCNLFTVFMWKTGLNRVYFKKSYNSSSLMFHYSQGKSCWYTCTHCWCSNPDNRVSGGNKRPLKERNKMINILFTKITHIWEFVIYPGEQDLFFEEFKFQIKKSSEKTDKNQNFAQKFDNKILLN